MLLAQYQLASHLLTMKHNFLAGLCCNFFNASHSSFVFQTAFATILLVLCAVGCYETVSSLRMEQQIKFLVKLRKTLNKCFKLLKEVYGEDVMSKMQVFKWHKCFENDCKEKEDDSKTG